MTLSYGVIERNEYQTVSEYVLSVCMVYQYLVFAWHFIGQLIARRVLFMTKQWNRWSVEAHANTPRHAPAPVLVHSDAYCSIEEG